eukprot:jgi/Mesen1/1868/ME000143S00923
MALIRVSAVGCQAAGREAETVAEAEEHVGDPGGVAEQGVTEEDVTEEGEGGKAKEWEPAADAYSVLASFQLREATRAGEIVVKAMRPEHVKSTAELLTESFADLFGVFTVKALLRLQVLVYLQQRLMLVPHGVTLVGLRYNEESKKDEVVATAELSFSSKSRVPFSTLDPPPEAAYLCNMAMGSTSLCLHCRLIDKAPNVLYKSAGFEFVEEDTLLGAALTFQRRRALLRKYISSTSLCLHCRLIDKAPNVLYKSAGFEFVEEDTLLGAALTFQRRLRVSAVGCQAAGREAETVAEAEEHVGDPGGVAEQGVTEEDVTEEGEGGKAKEWEPAADAYSVLASFQLREATRAGEIVVKAMRPEHVKSTAELLTESFADLFGVFTVKALLRLQVLVYLQQRLMLVPHGVTLVGLRYNEESKKDEVVATAELSFSSKSRVPFSTLDPPPEAAYLCNMAMGSTSLCLHCRLIDKAPNVLYKSAGFEFVEEDTLLGAALTFQRRRALLRKYISRRADAVEEEQQVAPLGEPSSSSIPL